MGVRRAVDLAVRAAENVLESAPDGKVYTLGPLIHNPEVLGQLNSLGVQELSESNLPENLKGISVIIRAHGVSPIIEAGLHYREAGIVDATCPRVKAGQLKAAELVEAGYGLFLAGEENHAEILSIKGYAKTGFARSAMAAFGNTFFCAVVGNAADAQAAAQNFLKKSYTEVQRKINKSQRITRKNPKKYLINNSCLFGSFVDPSVNFKTALIGQTTITSEEYKAIGLVLQKYFPNIKIVQSICPATEERQEALRELAARVEAIIVAGGKESANTRRLFAVAQSAGKPCVLIESEAEIPARFFRFETVGLASGASTPDFVIDKIEGRLNH